MIIRQKKYSNQTIYFRKRKNNLEFLMTNESVIRFLFIHLCIIINK